jgi:hypothetical protein
MRRDKQKLWTREVLVTDEAFLDDTKWIDPRGNEDHVGLW